MPNGQLELVKQPVQGRAVCTGTGANEQTGYPQLAVGGAPHIQHRAVYIKLLQPPAQHRPWRQRYLHTWQPQCGASLRIEQQHFVEFNRRDQAIGSRSNRADAQRYPQCSRGLLFEPRTQLGDSRHNQEMQSRPDYGQHQPR